MMWQNKLQSKKAFLFDLDGTLVDSMWIWTDIDIEYLGRFGLELPGDLQNCIEGMSFTETARYFKERFAIPDSLEEMKADWNRMAWEKYMKEVPLKPGVREFLAFYRGRGVKMAVATSTLGIVGPLQGTLKAHDTSMAWKMSLTQSLPAVMWPMGNPSRISIWRRRPGWKYVPGNAWYLKTWWQGSRQAKTQAWKWRQWRIPIPPTRNGRSGNWLIFILPTMKG